MSLSGRKIIYVVTEDYYFFSHRLPTARAAAGLGLDVVVVTGINSHKEAIEELGYRVINLPFDRSGLSLLHDLKTIWGLYKIFRKEHPDIVHNVAMKPALYGTLAARMAKVRRVVNNFAGLGSVFSLKSVKTNLIRPVVTFLFRGLYKSSSVYTLFQNGGDRSTFAKLSIGAPDRARLIQGSGIDVDYYEEQPEPTAKPVKAAMVSRLLYDKGPTVLAAAASLLKDRGVEIEILLVGNPDPKNSNSVPQAQLEEWHREGLVHWLGARHNIRAVWKDAHIGVLPSHYGEGVPKSLLEAAASGRALITTNIPGCRDVVRHEDNGLLVPARDPEALADALTRLVESPEERQKFGKRSRQRAVEEFSDQVIIGHMQALYKELLA